MRYGIAILKNTTPPEADQFFVSYLISYDKDREYAF